MHPSCFGFRNRYHRRLVLEEKLVVYIHVIQYRNDVTFLLITRNELHLEYFFLIGQGKYNYARTPDGSESRDSVGFKANGPTHKNPCLYPQTLKLEVPRERGNRHLRDRLISPPETGFTRHLFHIILGPPVEPCDGGQVIWNSPNERWAPQPPNTIGSSKSPSLPPFAGR